MHVSNAGADQLTCSISADTVRLLLDVGAGPNIADCDGRTACHFATGTWMRCAGTGRHRNASRHPDIPALLLAAGGDIFSPTANSRGARVAPPLDVLGAASSASEPASHAFLTHAAEQHAAGQWAPEPGINMRRLVQRAIAIRNKPFFFSFWQHAGFISELDKVQSLVRMGHLSAVNSLLSAGPAAQQNPMWSSMLATAITWQETDMVHLLLGHGVPVPCSALRAAVIGRRLQPAMLQLLLAAGPPPEPEPMPRVSFPYWTCPILTLLQRSTCRTWGVSCCACVLPEPSCTAVSQQTAWLRQGILVSSPWCSCSLNRLLVVTWLHSTADPARRGCSMALSCG